MFLTSGEAIYALIEAKTTSALPPSVGSAIYYYLRHRTTGSPAYLARAQALFEGSTTAAIGPGTLAPTDGLAGLAWLAAHLPGVGRTSALQQLDERLFYQARRLLEAPAAGGSPTLWRTLHYFTRRLASRNVADYLHDLLAGLSRPGTWAALARAGAGSGQRLPLGVVGSSTSEIILLVEIGAAGIQPGPVQQQVQQRVTQLLATKGEIDFSAGRYSAFPALVDKAGNPLFSNQLSWMRGADLGAALALYKAHALLGDAELRNIAELVGLNTLLRTGPDTTHLRGAQFCRGALGVAYAYARLHLLSEHPAYHRAYHYWCGRAEQWLATELAAGYYAQRRVDSLGGALGVGLMLLFAAAPAAEAPLHAAAIAASQH